MPRISNPSDLSSRPDSVVLCELAIAAGITGTALTVCFDSFPAVVLSELWGYCIRGVTTPAVLRVRGQRDLKTLEERMEVIRIVLVDSERLLAETQWAIQMEATASVPGDPLPAVLCNLAPNVPENLPGATMILHGRGTELSAITGWRRHVSTVDSSPVEVGVPRRVIVDPSVLSAIARFEQAALSTTEQQIMAEQILRGLLAGASLLRSSQDSASGPTDITITPNDYGFVRERLQRPIVGSTDVECDALAVDMVQRMNIYLRIRFGRDTSPDDPIWASTEEYRQLDRGAGRKPPVTRREIADLGNTKSGLIRRLVTSLKQADGGYGQFGRLGLARRPPPESDWSQASPDALARYLKPWSVKQVRTHFEVLQRRGLVTAAQEHTNGPWRYELPEALTTDGSPFAGLPPLGD